jgi:hypothetical protein
MTSSIPFEFVLDYLPKNVLTRKMFGMYYIYWGKKILLILRKRDNEPEMNGIWVATKREHHQSLKEIIFEPADFYADEDERHGNWLLIPDGAEYLEEAAVKICELIAQGDHRIGKLTGKPPL